MLELDPEHVEAGEPLAEIYFRDEQWQKLEPILDMLVRKATSSKNDNSELNQLYYRLARTADELGNSDKALKYYKLAYDLDSTFLPTLLGRAALLYKMEDWDGAVQDLPDDPRPPSRLAERGGDRRHLLSPRQHQAQAGRAQKGAQHVREGAGDRRDAPADACWRSSTCRAGGRLGGGHPRQARAARRSPRRPRRSSCSTRSATSTTRSCRTRRRRSRRTSRRSRSRPDNHVILHKVLDLYSETKQWKKAVEIIKRIAELEKDPIRRGKYYHAAARILRDEVKSLDEAIDYFNQALDQLLRSVRTRSPSRTSQEYLKAFEAIDKICTGKKDFKTQERNYRKMLKRMPADGPRHDQGRAVARARRDLPLASQGVQRRRSRRSRSRRSSSRTTRRATRSSPSST